MKKFKQSLAVLLTLCMLVGTAPLNASAAEITNNMETVTTETDAVATEIAEEAEKSTEEVEKTTEVEEESIEVVEETTEVEEESTEVAEEAAEVEEESTEVVEETTEVEEESTEVAEETAEVEEESTEVVVETAEVEEESTEIVEETTEVEEESAEVVIETIEAEETTTEVVENTMETTEITETTTAFVEALEPVLFSVRESAFLKVFHLDCGRKYFTVDQIKELIDAISNVGFSHMELAIGNDGLRLLLDDMSIEANGTSYDSDKIKNGIKSGNSSYAHSGEWTQSEMDEIIAYAKTKGIEIIPLVNNPGHMDSILAAMNACGIDGYYESSARTVDLENAEAVAFTQALVMKYAEYFASKGCSYFNIGADEYANDYHTDDSTGMGFGHLVSYNKYGNFIDYVNTLVEDICNLDMTPIAFNDGIYYNSTTSQGTFDTRLVVAAWTGGWGGIKPAKTSLLAEKGHQILNTNERWYYVPSASSGYTYSYSLGNVQSVPVTTVTDSTGVAPIGAMQCVWFDYPNVDYENYKSNVMTLINTLAENNPTYFTGPNVVEPETVTKTDQETGISASAPGLSDLTVTKIEDEANIPTIEGANDILVYDVDAFVDDEAYTSEITISVPVPAEWTCVRGGVLASDSGEEVLGIEGKLENSMFTFTVPHLSSVVTYAIEYDKLVELKVGETSETYTDDSGYYTTAEKLDTSIATVALGGNDGSEATVKYDETTVTCRDLLNRDGTHRATSYYVKADDGKYYPLYVSRTSNWSWESYSTQYSYTYYYSTDNGNSYTECGSQNNLSSTNTNTSIVVYTKIDTEAVPAKTTITFTGVATGETYATVGDTTYKIVVSKKTESATMMVGDVKTYVDNSVTVDVADSTVVDASIENGTLTITAKAVGATTVTTDNAVYTINVVEFDISTVEPIKVEWWITNIHVEATDGTIPAGSVVYDGGTNGNDQTVYYSAISAEEAFGENGVAVKNYLPTTARWTWSDKLTLWKGVRQTEDYHQTAVSGDMSASGDDFYYVRYYQSSWWISYDYTNWSKVSDTDKLVAYYLQHQDVTPEIETLFKDWGYAPGEGEDVSTVGLAIAVVYPDGTLSPEDGSVYPSTSIVFNYWENRDIGVIAPVNNSIYNISKITVTNGTREGDGNKWKTTDTINWEKVTNEAGSQWYDERTVWTADVASRDSNDTDAPMVNGAVGQDNVVWPEGNSAVLVLIYLEPVHYENNLIVKWVDDNAQEKLIHEIEVNVSSENESKNFYDELKQTSALPTEGIGGSFTLDDTAYVINSSGQNQTFNKDITIMSDIEAQYKSGLYKYVGAELDAEGSVLTLHYNIDPQKLAPMYVVDFGIPMEFPIDDLVENPGDMSSVELIEQPQYGEVVMSSDKITYTPTRVLQAIDVIPIKVTFKNNSTVTVRVGITPATTVYYGEQFLNFSSGWSTEGEYVKVGPQEKEILGQSGYYGYDDAYDFCAGSSDGTARKSVNIGDSATFTFTGTGIQVFANSAKNFGYVSVMVKNKATDAIIKVSMVDTDITGTEGTDTTGGQIGKNLSGLPVVSLVDLTGLDHATYEVTITKVMDKDPVYIDGIRVFGTVVEQELFKADEEDNPDFYEVRDIVLKAININASESKDYKTLYDQIYASTIAVGQTAVITNASAEYGTMDRQDLLDNGPKNELYLFKNDKLTINVSTDRVIQLGLKAPEGEATYKLNNGVETTLNTSVDMFYKIAEKGGITHTITVENTGETILSVTLLKVCDDPNFAFVPLTEDNIKDILADAGYPEIPAEPETPVDPEVPVEPENPVEPEKPTYTMVELKGTDVVIDGTVFDYTGNPIEPAITVNVNGTTLVEGKDYSVTYTNNVEPGTATVTVKGIATASETLGYTGEIAIDYTINAPVIVHADAVLSVKLVDYTGEKLGNVDLTINGVEGEKAVFTAEEILNAVQKQIPDKYALVDEDAVVDVEVVYGDNQEMTVQIGQVATLKVTFVNLRGKKQGSETITVVQTANGYCRISASEIRELAPQGRNAIWLLPAVVPYGNTVSIVVPVI